MGKIYLVCSITNRDALEPAKAFFSKEKANLVALQAQKHQDSEPQWPTPEFPSMGPDLDAARDQWRERKPLPNVQDDYYGYTVVELEIE